MLNDTLQKEMDRLSEEEENRDKARSLMLLSLFVLILAFFIVLVALSVLVEEKVRVGLASVREVFQAINDDSEIGVILPEDLSPGFTAGDILEDIAVVIVGEIQILELTMANDRRNLVVRLPLSDFFDLDSGEILENRRFLLRRIAAALEQGNNEITSHILIRGPESETSVTGVPFARHDPGRGFCRIARKPGSPGLSNLRRCREKREIRDLYPLHDQVRSRASDPFSGSGFTGVLCSDVALDGIASRVPAGVSGGFWRPSRRDIPPRTYTNTHGHTYRYTRMHADTHGHTPQNQNGHPQGALDRKYDE